MENNETLVTEPVVETKSEEMLPQSQVNGLIAKERKSAQEQLLKELGIEDVKSAKDGLKKVKELQEAQKTDLERKSEELEDWKTKYTTLEKQVQETKLDESIKTTLSSLEVDTSKLGLVKKLIDTNDLFNEAGINNEELQNRIAKVIEEELPELKKTMPKVGVEKQDETYQRKEDSSFLEAYKKLKK